MKEIRMSSDAKKTIAVVLCIALTGMVGNILGCEGTFGPENLAERRFALLLLKSLHSPCSRAGG